MDNIEGSRVTFTVDDGTNSSQISSASDHAQVSRFELDEVLDLAGGNVQLDCVINLHQWIRVTDGAPIMGGDERNTFGSDLDALDFAQFVLSNDEEGGVSHFQSSCFQFWFLPGLPQR